MKASASAPGKVILCGEHFVVYGEPALVAAVNLRAYVEAYRCRRPGIEVESDRVSGRGLKPVEEAVRFILEAYGLDSKNVGLKVKVRSEIPLGSGLGSSAAVSVASALAAAKLLGFKPSREKLFEAGFRAEKLVHGRPSGIDPAISVYGGLLRFKAGRVRRVRFQGRLELVVADSGIERSTGVMVEKVRRISSRYPRLFSDMRRAARRIVAEAVDAVSEGDFERLGELLNVNHGLLSAVGVSNSRLERLVYAAREAGALGAKITGAGGGGCILALARAGEASKLASTLKDAGAKAVYQVEVSGRGAF